MIGILIIAHGNLGDSLVHCANHVMGDKAPYLADLSISVNDDPDIAADTAQTLIEQLDRGEGAQDRAEASITDADDEKRLASNFTIFAKSSSP